jgi:hypothetical protein
VVTFRLTMAQFQEMLQVVLGPSIPDALSNKVLMVCTRPRDGVTEVALEPDEAGAIVAAVRAAGLPVGEVLAEQAGGQSDAVP